jgi:hypothetical protein
MVVEYFWEGLKSALTLRIVVVWYEVVLDIKQEVVDFPGTFLKFLQLMRMDLMLGLMMLIFLVWNISVLMVAFKID